MTDTEPRMMDREWMELRELVKEEDSLVSGLVFKSIKDLFFARYTGGAISPGEYTPEYERDEYLLAVDGEGRPPAIAAEIIEEFQVCCERDAGFKRWFRPAVTREGQSVLLAGRWLCHLVGLRHGTVEIFIDPPHLKGHTLVQVRALEKFEAPGAFDIPCAGHVNGVDTVEESLRKELVEELNLTLDDLQDLRPVTRYHSIYKGIAESSINNEFRVLYQARLRAEAAAKIRFTDGEVAGLAVFSIVELNALLQRYPERVASGLSDALIFYGL